MSISKQSEELALLQKSGRITKVSIEFHNYFEDLWNMRKWFSLYSIEMVFVDSIEMVFVDRVRPEPIDPNRNIVVIDLRERGFYFTQKDYALLFKLTWGGH